MLMESNGFKIIRWILILLVVFLLIGLIIFIIFRPNDKKSGNNNGNTSTSEQKPSTNIMDYSTTGTFNFTQDGRITAPENHRTIAIVVTNSTRKITIYTGYNSAVLNSKEYSNTQDSFNAFLQALGGAGFMTSRVSASGTLSGSCTLGTRFTYQLSNNTSTMPVNTWSNSCNAKQGTFGGNINTVQQLFKNQIPDYNTITQGVTL